jgi:hypothetical protein
MAAVKKEEIRSAISKMPHETLADALALFLAHGPAPEQAVAGMDRPELANFAQAVQYLKKNYDFAELDFFICEADLVYVQAGERRVLLTDRMNADSGSGGNMTGLRPETARNGSAPGAPAAGENDSPEKPGRDGGRFSNLEI